MKIKIDTNNAHPGKDIFFEGLLLVMGDSSACNIWDYCTLQEQLELLAVWLIEKRQREDNEHRLIQAKRERLEEINQRRQALKVVR